MPSVDASWKGQCVDHQVQHTLCGKIAQLSDLSNGFYKEYFKLDIHSTLYDGNNIIKDVHIPVHMLEGHSSPTGSKLDEKGKYIIENVSLFGIEFPLYDPRNYTPPFPLGTSNKISFVFIRCDFPVLDGRLVEVYHTKPDDLHPSGQTILMNPSLDLRYYLETWMMGLLGWVKHFYIPTMFYWLYGNYSGYGRYSVYDPNDQKSRETLFVGLLDEFDESAKGFTEYIKSFR